MPRRVGLAVRLFAVSAGWISVAGVVADEQGRGDPAGAKGSMVEGTVTYDGPLLKPIPVFEAGTERHPIEVDPKTKGLKDAVVWLEGDLDAGEADDAAPPKPAVMDQVNYFFVPHVLAVEAGRPVEFANSDGANHGVMASSLEPRNQFNVTTPPGNPYTHRFQTSKYPVAMGCPIHPAMAAWIYVFDHRYHDVTDERGRFRLPPTPPGHYTLHVRHPDGGMAERREFVISRGELLQIRVEFNKDDLKVRDQTGSPR